MSRSKPALVRWLLIIVGGVFLLLLVLQMVISPLVTKKVNERLATLPDFTGHVDSISIALWRGTVSADHFTLSERKSAATTPIATVKSASLSIAWLPLFKGRVGGHGKVSDVVLKMVRTEKVQPDAKEKEKKNEVSAGAARKWQGQLQETFPIEITRFEIENATIEFEDRTVQPAAQIKIEHFNLVATDVSNRPIGEAELPAKVTVTALLGGTGKLSVNVRANPADKQPRFSVQMEVKELQLPPIHDFLLAYALIDVRAGTFEVFSEVNAAGGAYDGYVKPFFKGLEFKAVSDPNKTFAQNAVTKVASAVTDLLKNEKDQVATKAPFKGNFADNQVDVWTAIENLLRNAFVQAIREGLEGQPRQG